MRKSIVASLAVCLVAVGLSACNGSSVSAPPILHATPPPVGATPPPPPLDTDFVTAGRNILVSEVTPTSARSSGHGGAAGVKVFIKGMDYAPTPIGQTPLDSPLKDSNSAMWGRDLPLLRAMGVNTIHVYNVTPPPYDSATGPIYAFLNAAWNNGDRRSMFS